MAGAVAEAGAVEEAAEILTFRFGLITLLRCTKAGCTHARNQLPRAVFAP
jgi:hypothetical protein